MLCQQVFSCKTCKVRIWPGIICWGFQSDQANCSSCRASIWYWPPPRCPQWHVFHTDLEIESSPPSPRTARTKNFFSGYYHFLNTIHELCTCVYIHKPQSKTSSFFNILKKNRARRSETVTKPSTKEAKHPFSFLADPSHAEFWHYIHSLLLLLLSWQW